MGMLEYIRIYLDSLFIFAKESFNDHLEKFEIVLAKLLEGTLLVNQKNLVSAQIQLINWGIY